MNIVAEMDEPDRSTVEMFMRTLEVNEQVAFALVASGLTILEEVAYISVSTPFRQTPTEDPATRVPLSLLIPSNAEARR